MTIDPTILAALTTSDGAFGLVFKHETFAEDGEAVGPLQWVTPAGYVNVADSGHVRFDGAALPQWFTVTDAQQIAPAAGVALEQR